MYNASDYQVGSKYGTKLITNKIGASLIAECTGCKKESIVTPTNLKKQIGKGCKPCLNKGKINNDLVKIGDRFGRRVVTGYLNNYKVYLKCDCGMEVSGQVGHLLNGQCQKCRSCLDKVETYKTKYYNSTCKWTTFDQSKPDENDFIVTWNPDLIKDFPTGIFKGIHYKDVYLADDKFRSCLWLKIRSPFKKEENV